MNMLTIPMFAVLFCCAAFTTGTLAKDCIGDQCPQIISVGLMNGLKATLKADLDVSKLNNVLFKYIQTEVTKAVKSEVDKLQGEKCMKGSTFVRWGRTSCDGTKSSLVYTGFMAGPTNSARGSGSNYLCLSSNPQTKSFPVEWNQRPGHLYGIGWELTGIDRSRSSNHVDDKDVPCAVCLTKGKTSLMIPGRTSCYAGWTHDYTGFLVSVRTQNGFASTEYVCADADPESHGSTNYNQGMISFVEVRCGSIPCSKYGNKTKLSCVVCSK
ncbi:short-chain collagen C4-like [Mytilus trossulus]|uniref:short-chain collagen C4-like n=1 Tax=Mytilus trossulus TaxID=6551 RepID=UPI003003F7C7